MNHTKQFIEDVIEGGYFEHVFNFNIYGESVHIVMGEQTRSLYNIPIQKILLDPLAWQAVGKVRGWSDKNIHAFDIFYSNGDEVDFNVPLSRYQYEMHRFIDHLANGHTIEHALGLLADKMRV